MITDNDDDELSDYCERRTKRNVHIMKQLQNFQPLCTNFTFLAELTFDDVDSSGRDKQRQSWVQFMLTTFLFNVQRLLWPDSFLCEKLTGPILLMKNINIKFFFVETVRIYMQH